MGVVVGFIISIALLVGAFIFGVHVVVWNVNDIINYGANFWNVFWLMLVAIAFLGANKAV